MEAANDRFSATMTNVVRWSDTTASPAGAHRKQLRSDTEIQVRCRKRKEKIMRHDLICVSLAYGLTVRDCQLCSPPLLIIEAKLHKRVRPPPKITPLTPSHPRTTQNKLKLRCAALRRLHKPVMSLPCMQPRLLLGIIVEM